MKPVRSDVPATLPELSDLRPETLPHALLVPPITRAIRTSLRPPGSKSLTNRALLLAALGPGITTLRDPLLEADDAQVMLAAIQQLGARVERPTNDTLRVKGVAGRWHIPPPAGSSVRLDLHNAGTAVRFLAAAALLAPPGASVIIDGTARMRQRPIADLGDALAALGGRVEYLQTPGCPPLRITPPALDGQSATAVREVSFTQAASSQFVSALMLVAPFLAHPLDIVLRPPITSLSYVQMTAGFLASCGVRFEHSPWPLPDRTAELMRLRFTPGSAAALRGDIAIEADASGAAPLLAAGVLLPGSLTVRGVPTTDRGGLQGDAEFYATLRAFGAHVEAQADATITAHGGGTLHAAEIDLAQMPDTAMTAAAVACFAQPTPTNPTATTVLRGLRTLRVKETDRIAALVTELAKVGVRAEPFAYTDPTGTLDEALRITPPAPGGLDCTPSAQAVAFDTYDDHRMAMALALIGLRRPNVTINDPACVRKTYPSFWADLQALYHP